MSVVFPLPFAAFTTTAPGLSKSQSTNACQSCNGKSSTPRANPTGLAKASIPASKFVSRAALCDGFEGCRGDDKFMADLSRVFMLVFNAAPGEVFG